jgi:formylglycine-generating enzyme required for sulfatase activity
LLFDSTTYEEIATHATRLSTARQRSGNLWQDAWDDRADAIQKAHSEAVSRDTPAHWRQICDLAVELRMEMKKSDGHETIYFTESVLLTDLIEKSLIRARANPQNLVAQDELQEMKEKALKTQEEIHEEYSRTPFWQPAKRRRLEAGEEKVKQTVIEINILSGFNFIVSYNNVDLGGTAKKASESVVDKATKIVNLVKEVVKLLNDETFTGPVKRAADEVWQAARRFTIATTQRFRALKLPEPKFDTGNGARIPVRIYPPAREQVRWIKPGGGRNSSEVFRDIEGGPEMVVVPAGKFMMGSPEGEPERHESEGPRREVTFAQPFAVGRHAVTRGQFAAFVNATSHKTDDLWRNPGFRQDDSHPVVCVNWDDAEAYASWLAKVTGRPYRLPTEAEWEYAARAGTTTPFWWGSTITPTQANYDGNYVYEGGGSKGEYRRGTVPAGSFDPNPWGLYNVHGNVWEWCEDTWHDSYKGAPSDGSAWIPKRASRGRSNQSSSRVVRGGAWNCYPGVLRSALRNGYLAENRYIDLGFRLGRTLTS